MEVLTRCRHNGFPVVRGARGDCEDDEDSGDFDATGQGASRAGPLQGIILRSQILVMLRHQVCFVLAVLKLDKRQWNPHELPLQPCLRRTPWLE